MIVKLSLQSNYIPAPATQKASYLYVFESLKIIWT